MSRTWPWIRVVLATAVLHLVLVQPNHPLAMTWQALLLFPLELPALLFALVALGNTGVSRAVRAVMTFALTALCVMKAVDFVSFTALSRGFNPVTDLTLIDAFLRLLTGSLGLGLTMLALLASVCAAIGVAWSIWWASGVWAQLGVPRWGRWLAAPAALACASIAVAEIGHVMRVWQLPGNPPGAAFTARLGVERAVLIRKTRAELRAFRAAAAQDPFDGAGPLLSAIDRDVLLVFIESYGRASFDTPLYSDLHPATLAEFEADLAPRGLAMRSGFLTSPTRGGQSWLSHSTLSNGLWITNQVSYAAALSSRRKTLFHHAAENGFRTAAVMPQITLDWPESAVMGFEEVLVAADMGYRGPAMNWVTMPDQFTLARLDQLVRNGADPRPLMAQVVLVSSHAPWVPVPDILPWDEIGDGTVYEEVAARGPTPEVLWRDRDRVRAQYRLAVDYALRSVLEYVRLHADDPPLIIALGDHQAAEFVAQDNRAEVPIHVIGPDHLVERLGHIAPTPGLIPDAAAPVIPMEDLRDMLLASFDAAGAVEAGH